MEGLVILMLELVGPGDNSGGLLIWYVPLLFYHEIVADEVE
jgi:hypothetical protein